MKICVILMGIQGSGKTYYYKNLLADRFVHINLDELHTRNKENLLIANCIQSGKDFCVDNTNPKRFDRAKYISVAKAAGYRVVGIFFESKISVCIKRNEQREGKARIDPKAIAATSNKLELPCYEEGFDELFFVRYDDGKIQKERWESEYGIR